MADQPKTADDVKAAPSTTATTRFVRLWFTDILGQLKSFSINAEELDDAFEGGMGFDGSSITGFNAIEESDMIAMPDLDVRGPAVATGGPGRRAHVRGHRRTQPRALRGDPRQVLRRTLERADAWASPTSTWAPSWSTSTSRLAKTENGFAAGDPRRGRLLRPDHARRRL